MKIKNKILIPIMSIIFALSAAVLNVNFSLAQTVRQLDVSGYILNNENKEIQNGEYEIKFTIYKAEQQIWEETQKIAIVSGIFNVYLGSVNPLPDSLDFNEGEYDLGIKIGEDSEMSPRKKIGAVPLAINSDYLRGAALGTDEGDILQLGKNGEIDIDHFPTGTKKDTLALGDDDRFHDQNTDTGTDSLEFNIGNDTALSGNNFDIAVSEQFAKPTLRFNGTTDTWQFSNDGTVFSNIGSGSAMGNYLLLAGGTMTGDISFVSTQTFGGATLTELGYVDGVTGSIQTQLDSKASTKADVGLGSVENTALSTWAGTANITTLGTISTGVWNGVAITTAYGGTGLASYTAGDMLYYSSGNTLTALGIGADGQVLRSLSGAPVWGAPVVGAAHNLLSLTHTDTTADNVLQGDIITGQDSGGGVMRWQRFAVGNMGQFLGTDGTSLTWNDTTSITQLGTITAGTWNADIIADAYIANDLTLAGATIGTSDITLVQSVAPTPTAEGRIEWDTNDDRLVIGDGASQAIFYSGPGAGGISGLGTNNYATYWTGASTLGSEQYLSVSRGGTGTGIFTSHGVLYGNTTGAIGATAAGTSGQLLVANGSGVPTFVSMSGDVNIIADGTTAIQADSVTLTTDTTGNYVASITNGSGISGGDGGSEAAGLTLSLGALTADWNQTGAFDIVLGSASSELKIMESTGATFYGILDVSDLTADRTYTLPNTTGTVAMTSDLHNAVTLAGAYNYLTLSTQQITLNQIDLTTDVTGTLPVGNGGTGATTFISHGVLYGNTAGAIGVTSAGTDGQLLIATTSGAPAFTAMSGDMNITNAGVTAIQADAIGTAEIVADTILESDLDATNAPTDNYILSYDLATGGFTWVIESGGTGASKWTDSGTYTYLTETADDLAIGGSTAATAGFFFDVGTGSIQIEGSADDFETTLAINNPTADQTITFQDASGTVAYQSELHSALTVSGAYNYITLAGQDIVRGQIDLTTDVTGTLPVGSGGTGATSFTSHGVLYGNTTGAIGATAAGTSGQLLVANGSGVPTFVSMSGDVNIIADGTTAIQADSVTLTTDTTGNYVASITNGSGISGGDGGSEAAGLTLSLGALTADWNQTGAFDIVLGSASSELKIMESTGATFYGILDVSDLTADRTYTLPNTTGTVAMTSDLHDAVTLAGTPDYITISASQVITRGQIDLTTDVTGTLPVGNGGTGATTFISHGVLYGNTAGAIGVTSAGTDGQLLIATTSGAPAFTAMSGDMNITNAGVTAIQADAIGSSEILDDSIAEVDLNVTNDPTNGYILSYNGTGSDFTWITNTGGSGASKWSDSGTYTYLTETSDGLVLGSTAVTNAKFFFDISDSSITFEGANDDDYETKFVITEPTMTDRTITFPDASGTVVFSGGAGSSKWTDSGTLTYLSETTDDLVVGGSALASAFSINVSANTVRIGTGATANAVLNMYASDGDTGSLTYTTSDAWAFENGDVGIGDATPAALFSVGATSQFQVNSSGAIVAAAGITSSGTITFSGLGTGIVHSDAAGILSSSAVDITSADITGTLAVGSGGTGATSFTSHGVLYGNTASAIGATTAGTDGQLLIATTSGAPAFTAMSGDVNITNAGVTTIQADAIGTAEIVADTILESDLDATNAPTDNYILSYDLATGGFTWVIESGGTGASKWTDSGTYTYLTETADDLAIGGSTAATAGFFFDVGTGSIQIEGSADDFETTLAINNPTADQTITFQDASGTVAYQSELHSALTVSGAYNYITLAGQDIVRGQIDLTTDVTGTLPVGSGGTGATSFTSHGVLYGNTTGAIGATAAGTSGQLLVANGSGVPTFVSMSGDVNIIADGTTAIQADSVTLTTDTTGNYVASITNGSGISGGDGGSEAAGLTLSLGALTADWNQTGAFDIVLGSASSELKIMESTGATFYGILDVSDLTADKTYTLPNTTGTVAMTSDLHDAVTLAGTPDYITISASQVITRGQIDLTTDVTGALPVTNGGTGATTFISHGVLYGNTAGAIGVTSAGTDGQLLIATTSGAPAFTAMSGDMNITNAGVTAIQADAIGTAEIVADTILESDLDATNAPTDNYILSYDLATGGFTWVIESGGTGASKWTDSGTYTYLTETADDLAIGGSTAATAGFFFDVGTGSIQIEGSADDFETTLAINNPTADQTITFQDASGTVAYQSELHSALTVSGAYNYITLAGQDIVRGQIDLTTDVTGTLPAANGGTGINTSASTGVPIITTGTWSVAAALGVAYGGTGESTEVGLENKIEAYIFDSDAQSVSGVWTVLDGVALQFGTGSDIAMSYDGTVDNRLELSDGTNLLLGISDAGTVGNLFASGGISTYDNAVADGYGEFTGLCLGNGTNCITSWGSAGAIDGSGSAGYVTYWVDANTLTGEQYLATSRGGTQIDTASSTGVATVSGGTWSILATLGDSYISALTGASQGDVLYHNGASWAKLGAGTGGQYLETQGVGANPQWSTVTTHDAVTLAGAYDYLTLATQQITLNQIDLTTDVSGLLPAVNGGTGLDGSSAANGTLLIGNGTGYTLTTLTDGTGITITEGAGSITIASTLGAVIDTTEITDDTILEVDLDATNIASDGQVLTFDNATGGFTWSSAGSGGIGDITAVGDAITGDAFTAAGTGNNLYFEGSTTDDIETILTAVDPTASDKTITLPNATGYTVLDGTICTDIEGTGLSIGSGTLNWSSTGLTWAGNTIAVGYGGTGATTASGARTNLGLVIGSDVLAYDAGLQNLAGVAMLADRFYYTTADNTHAAGTVTSFTRSILDDANEAAFKATVNLEIGTDVLAQQTIGIADNNLVEIDSATAADDDYAKFTANGLEGRSYSEVKIDLSLNNVENTALSTWAGTTNITTLGTIGTGVWEGTTIDVAHGGTGASTLTGMLKGNGAGAFTAVTGTANYATYWSNANTIAAEQYLHVSRGGTGTGTQFTLGSIVFAGASGVYTQDNANFFWDSGNHRLGIGTLAPSSDLEIYSSTANPFLTITGAHNTDYDPMIKFRTDASPTVKFSMGVDAGDSDKFKIYSGDGIGGTSEFMIDTSGTTSISNLELGAQSFETNAGAVGWIDMPVTSAAAIDTVESYTAMIDGNGLLTIYAESDGAGGIQDSGVGIGTTTPTAYLHIKAGTATAGTAPLKFISGTNLTTPEAGAIEFDGTDLFYTTSVPTRRIIVNTAASQTLTNKTLSTGSTWNGTAIGAQYGGTGLDGSSAANGTLLIGNGTGYALATLTDGTGITITEGAGSITIASTLGTSVDLTSEVTGILPLANGGTNANLTAVNGGIVYSGASALAISAAGTTGQALISGGTGAPTWFAPTAGSILFAGASGILSQDNANFFWDSDNHRLGIGTLAPSEMLDIYGTGNKLRLSYDTDSYVTLAASSTGGTAGALDISTTGTAGSKLTIGGGSALNASIVFDGEDVSGQNYYVGLDDADDAFKIGLGTAVGTTPYITILHTSGNVGIGTITPSALLSIGATSQFQVNSSGVIAAAAGITSSGTITFSGLGTNGVVSVAGGVLASAATLTHEMGGLEADVSAYGTGLYGQTAGNATIDIDTEAEIETALGGLDIVTVTADDITSANLATALSDETGTGLAVFATTPTFTISLYSPLIIGGIGTTSDLSFQTTSGVGASGADMHFLVGDNGGTEAMTILNNGNIGIGTLAPSEMLDIYGTSNKLQLSYDESNYATLAANASGELVMSASATGGSSMVIGDGSVEDTSIIFDGSAQDYYAGLDDTDDAFKIGLGTAVGTNTYLTILPTSGKVGIDIDAPSAKLDIDYDETATAVGSYYGLRGDVDSTGIFATAAQTSYIYGIYGDATASGISTAGTVNTYGGYFTATGESTGAATTNAYGLYVNGATGADNNYSAAFMNGNVGIGVATPSQALDVEYAADGYAASFFNDGGTDARQGIIIQAGLDANPTSALDWIQFLDGDGGQTGSVRGDGSGGVTYGTGAADYAEYFWTEDDDLKSGEAVCVDVARKGAVKRCERARDGNIIGIVSTAPAFLGNSSEDKENNPNYTIVGMLGQVPARVSAENGEIRPGDSLTSSSIPGHIMKADAGDSTVGVALENLSKEKGVINVLISRRNKSLTVEKIEDQITDRVAQMEIEDEVNLLISQAVDSLDLGMAGMIERVENIETLLTESFQIPLNPPFPKGEGWEVLNSTVADNQSLITDLQEQMDLIQEQNNALMDFMLSVETGRFVKADEDGDVDLLDGQLEAGELVAGVFTVKVIDKESPTIGTAVITPPQTDTTDEETDATDNNDDGQSVLVETKAISASAKIFTSFENNPGSSSWVEKAKDDEGDYTGFKILLSEPVSEEVKVNWWIVEEER